MKYLQKKTRLRPIYKKLTRVRVNLFKRDKVLKFKRRKWRAFRNAYKWMIQKHFYQPPRYTKEPGFWRHSRAYYQPNECERFVVTSKPDRWSSYSKRYLNKMLAAWAFRKYYGGFNKRLIKRRIAEAKDLYRRVVRRGQKSMKERHERNMNKAFMEYFESRLDSVLFRSKFAFSARSARQMIQHGKILVNNRVVKSFSYRLKEWDLVQVIPTKENSFQVWRNLKKAHTWPMTPEYLLINVRTMTILLASFKGVRISFYTDFPIDTHKLSLHYRWN